MTASWTWVAPLLIVVVLSLVNGLLKHAPVTSAQRTVLQSLLQLLDRIAPATRRDSPGTFKVPGRVSAPPETIVVPEEQVTPVERPEGK